MKKSIVATLAGTVVLASVSFGGVASAMDKSITISIDGEAEQVHVWGSTVQDALNKQQVVLTDNDLVVPAASDKISDGSVIEVKYGRQITVIIDGVEKTFWTTATDLEQALAEIGLHDTDARLSVDRSLELGREGLTFAATTPKDVTIQVGADVLNVSSTAADVAGLLAENGIAIDENDRVTPSIADPLKRGLTVKVTKVDVQETSENQTIGYETKTTEDAELADGTTKVVVAGTEGQKTIYYEVVLVDGVEESRTVIREEVVAQPVTREVTVGTKPAPPAPTYTSSATSVPAAAPASYGGSHADWMAAAGIAASDFSAAEILIQRESSWNPAAVNPSSGACGLVQALPCSKLGPNWSDPVVALQWGDNYVKQRYGGWQGALAHSYANGWY